MEVRLAVPHQALRGIVQSFSERRASLGAISMTWPLPARPHQIIDIYLAEPFGVSIDGGLMTAAPEVVVGGPQSQCRTYLAMSGEIHVFNILFQPAGFNRLTGIAMAPLVNAGVPASDVLGRRAALLRNAVLAAPDFLARVAAAERWVGAMLAESPHGSGIDDEIGRAARLMVSARGLIRIDALASVTGLSARQFQRRFTAQVGLPPKLYARTIRFDAALTAHRLYPAKLWTEVVHEAGYFDQAHFVRECRDLVGVPPSQLVNDWENVLSPADG